MISSSAAPPIRSTVERRRPARRRHDAEAMKLAAEADRGAVAQAAARRQLRAVGGLAREVATEPRLAIDQEVVDVAFRVRPAAAAGDRDGHHHTAVGVDDDPQAARPRRAAERIGQRAAGQPDDRRGLGRGSGDRVVASARAARPSVTGHDRRSRRPGRSPVSAPPTIAGRPLTMTWSMPTG